ncbi:helix-turn-helix domain-containing protein [Gimibacter soli]|uniref:XRE family transcriptional regulator n=1 Tax=Gimibacter soli TaxID=3024400 RepID=A0AAE9XW30_9PROT|nr:XRE family transcriptional regulator [Gimibacter soli]WCL55248.1 XRE family transcriptional regulator [Gimibacter soli]
METIREIMAAHPGITLRDIRTERAMTLKELAEKSGIPVSTLSKLENGKMTMTYDKLVRIGIGLGVDLGRLLSTPHTEARPAPSALGRRCVTRAGKETSVLYKKHRHFYPASELLNKQMVPMIIDVKARTMEEIGGLLRHTGEEFLYVLEGTMELHSELYTPLKLSAGDSVYFDSGMAHAYILAGESPCRVLAVCAGAGVDALAEAVLNTTGHGEDSGESDD